MPHRQLHPWLHRRRRRALVMLVLGLLAPLLLTVLPVAPTPAHAAEQHGDPLSVSIDSMDPLSIDGRPKGKITMSGKVTNTTDDSWGGIKIYPFIGDTPITTSEGLAEAADLPADALVGKRIVRAGAYATVPTLKPGQSYSWSLSVPRRQLGVTQPGVYWFGVHALGAVSPSTADGRARTFLPLVKQPRKKAKAEKVAMVMPLRRSVVHAPDGSIAYVPGWTRDLRPGGRLYRMLETGAAMPGVTWAIDPAIIDAARNLAAGNPSRNMGATDTDDSQSPDPSASPSGAPSLQPSPSESPSPSETSGSSGDSGSAGSSDTAATLPRASADDVAAAKEAASAWLDQLASALEGHNLLALPYGDPDVSALATGDPDLLATAREQTTHALAALGIKATPAVSTPTGFLDRSAVNLLEPGSVNLVNDKMFRGDEAPTIASLDGHEMIVASSAAAAGGPGPNERLDAVSVRQRIASEAALMRGSDKPLVVVVPSAWHPAQDSAAYASTWEKASWIAPSTLTQALSGQKATKVAADDLRYPRREMRAEISAEQIQDANELITAGELLQRVLTHNDKVASDVTGEALTATSYFARTGETDAAAHALDEISAELGSITVSVPPKVILSSMKGGEFQVSVSNELDEPVTVRLDAITDDSVRVATSDPVQLDANSRASFNLSASMQDTGTHTAQIVVTDTDGNPLGAHASVPIRPSQVSGVVWWFVGTGCALLFAAIAVRLTRRIIKARRARTTGDV